jgi:hypothetical protein
LGLNVEKREMEKPKIGIFFIGDHPGKLEGAYK